ncbi:MAG TPA: DegQ family serine endoprotease [Geobacteraceae bacterium]
MVRKEFGRFGTICLVAIFLVISTVSQGVCDSESHGFPRSFADLAEKVKPAVVNISSTSTVKVPGNPFKQFFGPDEQGPLGDFFHHFFQEMPDQKMKQQSLGSGFIINRDGFIITNNHVVENAEEIKVKLADGREFQAKVIGRDSKTDLALIKIAAAREELPFLALGDSAKMRVGDWVLAVGNPFGLGHTVTQGIISATGRVIGSGPYDEFLQTDAPINPGNSGGPLVNLKGEVIGINTAIIASGQGIGFAIPSDLAKSVITQLKEKGKVVRGWMGVAIQTVTPDLARSFGMKEAKGALVSELMPGGPAEKGGVKTGDIIIAFDGKEIRSANDLPLIVAETPVGKSVDVAIIRNGKAEHLTIKVAELTEKVAAAESAAPVQSLGMKVENITPQIRQQLGITQKNGVVAMGVEQGSVAAEAGIQAGDIIFEVNRGHIRNLTEYEAAMKKAQKGQPVLFLVKRGKQTFYVSMEVSGN